MIVSLLVAMSENRVIGRHNRLPWHLPPDLKRFKALTTGHAIIMGRKTFESIGRPLANRRSIVISRRPDFRPEGVEVVASLSEALARAADHDEVFIIGGAEIFRHALPLADRIYLTMIHAVIDGDAHFPDLDQREWNLVADEHHDADDRHAHAYSFRQYERSRRG